jgi:hypothetical protein
MNNAEFESRLQRLERRVSRYRLTSVLLGLGLIGLAGIAANAPIPVSQELRTHKLVVLDEKGKEGVALLTGPHGGVLQLLNSEGIPVIRAGASATGGKFAMADPKGQEYLEATSEEAGGQLMISDKKGQKTMLHPTMTPKPVK